MKPLTYDASSAQERFDEAVKVVKVLVEKNGTTPDGATFAGSSPKRAAKVTETDKPGTDFNDIAHAAGEDHSESDLNSILGAFEFAPDKRGVLENDLSDKPEDRRGGLGTSAPSSQKAPPRRAGKSSLGGEDIQRRKDFPSFRVIVCMVAAAQVATATVLAFTFTSWLSGSAFHTSSRSGQEHQAASSSVTTPSSDEAARSVMAKHQRNRLTGADTASQPVPHQDATTDPVTSGHSSPQQLAEAAPPTPEPRLAQEADATVPDASPTRKPDRSPLAGLESSRTEEAASLSPTAAPPSPEQPALSSPSAGSPESKSVEVLPTRAAEEALRQKSAGTPVTRAAILQDQIQRLRSRAAADLRAKLPPPEGIMQQPAPLTAASSQRTTQAPLTAQDSPAPPLTNPSEHRLLEWAEFLLKNLDISSARLILEKAAEDGGARAAYLLAQTYDSRVLQEKWQAQGIKGDPVKAQKYYSRAQAGGVHSAEQYVPTR